MFQATEHVFVHPEDYEDDLYLACELGKHFSDVPITTEEILDKLYVEYTSFKEYN